MPLESLHYTQGYLCGVRFQVRNPEAPNPVVPGVLGGLLARQEHTAALRFLKVLSLPHDTCSQSAFKTLVYRVFERAHGLVCVDIQAWNAFESAPCPRIDYPRNLHTLHLGCPTIPFAQSLLTAPSLKEVRFSHPCYFWHKSYYQGPFPQVTSLRYIHQGGEPCTNDELLKMCELFPSVERVEVEIGVLRKFLDCVPHMARVKHLYLVYGGGFYEGQPPADERTKGLLMGALNALCPALETGEVRLCDWREMWVRSHGVVERRGHYETLE